MCKKWKKDLERLILFLNLILGRCIVKKALMFRRILYHIADGHIGVTYYLFYKVSKIKIYVERTQRGREV